eukprot:5173423-Prymnesium_polylepis.1
MFFCESVETCFRNVYERVTHSTIPSSDDPAEARRTPGLTCDGRMPGEDPACPPPASWRRGV